MALIRDRDFRDKLEKTGVRIANDLTRQQASVVAEARKEGKVAYFKKGKLTVGPKRPDPRTYAEVTAADDTRHVADSETTTPRSAGRVNTDSSQREHSRQNGDSPPGDGSVFDTQAGSSRSPRANRGGGARGGPRQPGQPGLRDYWDSSGSTRSAKSPGNKHRGRNPSPRRSERNRQR